MNAALAAPRRRPTPGRCRSRTASTCSPPAFARRWASRCTARPGRDRADRTADRSDCCRRYPARAACSRSASRGGYFLDFDWNREQTRALRPERSTTRSSDHERHRRRQRHDDDRRAGALPDQRALPPRLAQRSWTRCPGARCRPGTATQIPLAEIAHGQAGHRPFHAARRERHADRLCVRGCRGPRLGSYVAEAKRAVRGRAAAAGLHAGLERPVRGHGTGAGSGSRSWCR